MDYQEYMTSLEEQIHNKHAKKLVCKEIHNHIEEQAESYQAEGLDSDLAFHEAVRQMGDPVETGAKLNRIHKPIFPIGLFAVAIILTFVGILMQSIIFPQVDNTYIAEQYLWNTIIYNGIGLFVIFGILLMDYTYMVKFAYVLYGLYLVVMIGCNSFIYDYARSWLSSYYLWVFYPIIFATLLYKNKSKGIKGIIICYGMTLIAFGIRRILPFGANVISGGALECYLLIFLLIFFAVNKGIMGGRKKSLYLAASIPIILASIYGIYLLIAMRNILIPEYQIERLKYILLYIKNPELYKDSSGYIIDNIRDAVANFSLWGNQTISDKLPINDMYSTFVINGIFSWFGIVVGIIVIVLLLGFSIRALCISTRQRNRIGMLIGFTCSLSILIRTIAYLLVNFGLGIYYTTSIPFLTYGKLSSVVNAIFVGIILCVYRNSNVLGEEVQVWRFAKPKEE